jgi:hypothetical protein
MTKPAIAVALALLPALLASCRTETREAAEARARKALYQKQIAQLETLVATARQSGVPRDRLYIGVTEDVFREVVRATLPRVVRLGQRVRLRLETAEASFRYSTGVVQFEGRVESVEHPSLFLAVRLAGGLDRVDYAEGRLTTRIRVYYFEVLGSALGDIGKAVIEGLAREHMSAIENVVPPIEIPVRVEQGLTVAAFNEGPVSAGPGTLPFAASVARVITLNGRLWIGLDLRVGPWKREDAPSPSPAAEKRR